MKQFYDDLFEWVSEVNMKSSQMPVEKYWVWVFDSGTALVEKYKKNELVKRVVQAHLDYLVDVADGGIEYPF